MTTAGMLRSVQYLVSVLAMYLLEKAVIDLVALSRAAERSDSVRSASFPAETRRGAGPTAADAGEKAAALDRVAAVVGEKAETGRWITKAATVEEEEEERQRGTTPISATRIDTSSYVPASSTRKFPTRPCCPIRYAPTASPRTRRAEPVSRRARRTTEKAKGATTKTTARRKRGPRPNSAPSAGLPPRIHVVSIRTIRSSWNGTPSHRSISVRGAPTQSGWSTRTATSTFNGNGPNITDGSRACPRARGRGWTVTYTRPSSISPRRRD
mmetsp:Transcript_21570/g.63244  ORF Transcript_21570/g.63244 Transcript_21570/m.63244 type:complete len:269 (+) Transcript_21570:462-1268(+)